jgi:hypothetical protein
MKKKIIILAALVGVFFILHSTSSMALRTHVFLMGYPKAAIFSDIIDDEYHNEVDKEKFAEINAKAYTLTKPQSKKLLKGN